MVTSNASPTTYGLLGMLAVRSWTGYELTQQLRRSLRFVWPSSEGHLYREQKRLVDLGWARVEEESANGRRRKRYLITERGETALAEWMASPTGPPRFEIEGMLRLFHGTQDRSAEMAAAMHETARAAQQMIDELVGFAAEYLEDGGPLWMLEHDLGGPGARIEWRGREMFPERLHVIALVIEGTTRLLETLAEFASVSSEQLQAWASLPAPDLTAETRARLENVVARHGG
jgi:PadR family transcriptional regulator AphA